MRAARRVPGLLLLSTLLLPPARAAVPREDTLLLFHTNDLHGHVERAATLAGLVRAERAKRRDVLWLDAGDFITGTPVSTVFRGIPVFTVASLMGIDAGCLGNHELDYGWARVALFREAASFPLLCANAWAPPPPGKTGRGPLLGDAAWQVFDVDGVRVGVIGALTEDTPRHVVRRGNEGVVFERAAEALRRLVPEVRPRCDLLVALTHVGYEGDLLLARDVKGIDVIVGGHSHTDLPGPVKVGRTLVVQAGCYGRTLGRLDLVVDLEKGGVARWEGKPVPVDTATQPLDPKVAAAVRDLEAKVEGTVGAVVAKASRPLGKADLQGLAERAFREALGTDLGYMNAHGVRDTVPAGPVTVRQLWTAFPFDDTLYRVRAKGAVLGDWARRQLGAPPEPARVYTVATNTFVADHLQEEIPGAEPGAEDSGLSMRDCIVEWVRARKDL